MFLYKKIYFLLSTDFLAYLVKEEYKYHCSVIILLSYSFSPQIYSSSF